MSNKSVFQMIIHSKKWIKNHSQNPGKNYSQVQSKGETPLMATPEGYLALLGGVVLIIFAPFFAQSDYWMGILVTTGLVAMASIGLSLLSGYAGQISLGHAAFITIGGYTAAYFGATRGLAFPIWLLLAGVVGGLIGLLIGPFSLRFKGDYLVVITLALIFITVHVVENWTSVTGGHSGIPTSAALNIGPIDFANLSIFGKEFTRSQGTFYLAWIMVGITALVARNIVRSRPGRALQAIRDRDIASEVIGINNTHFKISVFVLSSAIASMAGGVLAVHLRYLSPQEPVVELFTSIEFLAIIVVGGLGTIYGAILGALFIGPLEALIEEAVRFLDFTIPFTDKAFVSNDGDSFFNVAAFSAVIYATLLVVFLIFQPQGIAGLIRKLQILIRTKIARNKTS